MQELVKLPPIDQKRGTKKRKYEVDLVTEAKRPKQEFGDGFLCHRKLPSLARRPAQDVLEEVVVKVTNGDRQMAGHLLREFSQEHLSSIGEGANAAGDLLLDALLKARHDQVANGLLRVLKFVLGRVEAEAVGATLKRLFQDGDRLVSQSGLEPRILALVTEGLERRALREEELSQSIFRCAERAMKHNGNSQARVCAVQFQIARCLSAAPSFNAKSCQELENILCDMILDRDSRVRIVAVEGLLALAERDLVSLNSYTALRHLIYDTDGHVRKKVLMIFLRYAKKWPSEKVTNSSGQSLLLCDDAFSSICHCINDMEVDVRAEAATLLGEFESVSDEFLEQTLDKKLMRTMKTTGAVKYEKTSMFAISNKSWVKGGRWRNWKDSNKDKNSSKSSGEWASGKDLNAPCPNKPGTSQEPLDQSIIPQGACGAFVTALEDEFMTVRKGAVYSLGKLAAHRPGFASTALEHLTDMFNDEIADVRLDAIHALTPLVVHGQLQKEQLAVMLKCLDDAMFESRQALRELLAKGEFADAECMKMTARALINCLQRFPSDQEMIYRCMSELGSRHGVFVHSMVTGLLDLHPIFEPQEQNIDDVFYKAKLILVLSAASSYDPVLSLVPEYVLKHYRLMRASVPHLVPAITSLDDRFGKIARQAAVGNITPTTANAEILGQTYSKLCDAVFDATLRERNLIRQFISSDAEAICSFNTVLAGSAQFLAVLSEICSAVDSLEHTVLCGGDLSRVKSLLSQEVNAVLSAIRAFSDVEPAMLAYLGAVAFHLQLLAGVAKLILHPEGYPAVIQEIREAISEARRSIDYLNCPPVESQETVISGVLDVIDRCGIDDKKFLTAGKLGDLLRKNPPILPIEFQNIDKIKVKWVQITEPDKHLAVEKPIKFTAGYPTSMNLAATLHHLSQEDLSDIRIQIDYPDQSRTFFRPRAADYSKAGEDAHKLSTKVLLHSSIPWTDAALVKFTVVLMTGPARTIPVVALESPSVRRPASFVAKIRPF